MAPSFSKLALLAIALGASGISAQEPAEFTPLPSVGGGGSTYKDSPHFRIYGASDSAATAAIKNVEAAYDCFVKTIGWRSSGLSYNSANDNGPWYKVNIYSVAQLDGAAGVMGSDAKTGMAFLTVVARYLAEAGVTVHEWGHGITYTERNWVDQGRTGAWWEPLAEWVADTFMTSPLCAASRTKFGVAEGRTIITLGKTISDSFQVLVDGTQGSGNYYQAWPFYSYLTYNPDNYAGLGTTAVRDMIRKYSRGSNETPLHSLARVTTAISVPKLVGRYWARMAYVDIGHKQANSVFLQQRGSLNYANLDSQGSGKYKVKSARKPRYMGANIIPLKASAGAAVSVQVVASNSAAFTATLAIRNTGANTVRYIELANGSGSATVASGEEASLVVANTPANLLLYDAFAISAEANTGLDYTVTLTGATA